MSFYKAATIYTREYKRQNTWARFRPLPGKRSASQTMSIDLGENHAVLELSADINPLKNFNNHEKLGRFLRAAARKDFLEDYATVLDYTFKNIKGLAKRKVINAQVYYQKDEQWKDPFRVFDLSLRGNLFIELATLSSIPENFINKDSLKLYALSHFVKKCEGYYTGYISGPTLDDTLKRAVKVYSLENEIRKMHP